MSLTDKTKEIINRAIREGKVKDLSGGRVSPALNHAFLERETKRRLSQIANNAFAKD
jgi:hypothetical protein